MGAKYNRIFCIMNPAAGTRQRVRQVVEEALSSVDFVFCETEAPGHASVLVQEAIAQEADCVFAIGGDGTVNEVGQALIGYDLPLGVVPIGSGNAFARALNISRHPHRACQQLLQAGCSRLDVGRVGDAVFLSTAGVGLDAEVVWRYAARTGKRRGLLPYVMLAVQALKHFQPEPLTLILDDGDEIALCPFILAVANTAQYGNGVTIAPGAQADDGVLDVCVISARNRLSLVLQAWRLFTGTIDCLPGVVRYQAQKVQIKRAHSGWYQIDGEAREGAASLTFEIQPKALSVLVPGGKGERR